MHVDDGRVARAAQHEIDGGGIVDGGRGVGLADDGGDAAGGGGLAGGSERLAAGRARLADEGAHVDQARRDQLAAAVDHLGAFRHAGGADALLGLADDAVGDQHVAGQVEIARRIDDPGVGEQDRAAVERAWLRIRQIPRQGFQHRHAHGDAHLDLLADERLGAVGDD